MQLKVKVVQRFCCAAVFSVVVSSAAQASLIEVISDGANSAYQLGQVNGYVEYSPTAAQLTITLTNVSDPANGGYITAFLFNIDSQDPAARASLTWSTHAFRSISGVAPPFGGPYAAGAAVGNTWSGGGSPQAGVGVGQTGVFVFDVHASDAATLSATSFISGTLPFDFVVRFRGFEDGRSDKVPVMLIPTPATLGLLAVGAIVGTRRRRR